MHWFKSLSSAVVWLGAFLLGALFFPPGSLAKDGDPLWGVAGKKLQEATSPHSLSSHRVISDGNGGAIVVYVYAADLTPITYSAHLEVQRLDPNGTKLWTQTVGSMAQAPAIIPDGAGGVIVAWLEGRMDANGYRILAQRFKATGASQWGTSGVQVSNAFGAFSSASAENYPVICPDKAGGGFIGWGRRLAQVDASGVLKSPGKDGIELIPATPPGSVGAHKIISDGTGGIVLTPGKGSALQPGGVYAAWVNISGEIYAQRVKAGLQWTGSGVKIGQHGKVVSLDLARDNSGGLLVGWVGTDQVGSTPKTQMRGQRLKRDGTKMWPQGVLILDSSAVGGSWPANNGAIALTNDGKDGAIAAWLDYRHAPPPGETDTYAQRFDANGALQWTANGVLLPPYIQGQTAPGTQGSPRMVSDLVGGAIVTYMSHGDWSQDIAGTRLSLSGQKLWSNWVRWDGSSAQNPGLNQKDPEIAFDASGPVPKGAIIVYYETDNAGHHRLYAQKVEIAP